MVMIVYTFVIHRKMRQDKKRHKSIQCWVGVELFNLYVRSTLYQRCLGLLYTLLFFPNNDAFVVVIDALKSWYEKIDLKFVYLLLLVQMKSI